MMSDERMGARTLNLESAPQYRPLAYSTSMLSPLFLLTRLAAAYKHNARRILPCVNASHRHARPARRYEAY